MFSSKWKFSSEQEKKDTEQSTIAGNLFIKHLIVYLSEKEEAFNDQILSVELFKTIKWKDKLAFVLGQKTAYKDLIKTLEKLKEN